MPITGLPTNGSSTFSRALQWLPVIVVFTATILAAEKPTIVELEERLPTAIGVERLEILNELANGLCLRATDAAVAYGRQAVAVVSQIHFKGVLHRDLKPENIILIQREGNSHFVKLLDFGLARTQSLTRLTQSGMIVGTIGYLAPEQINDQHCSTSSDIYAPGVIFYELLTQQPAFPGDTPVDMIKQILEASPVPPREYRPEISETLNDLVLSMMAKNPVSRPEGAAIAALLDLPDTAG